MTNLLKDALSSAVATFSRPSRQVATGPHDHVGRTPHIDSEQLAILRTAIERSTHCSSFINQDLVWGGRSVNLNSSNLAWWLVERAATTSASQAIHDLDAFGGSDSIPGSVVMAIAGPEVKDPDTLSNRVALKRLDDIPRSMPVQSPPPISNGLMFGTWPTCLLVVQYTTPRALGSASKAAASSQRAGLKRIRQDLNDVRLGLVLASNGGASVHSYWAAPNEDIPCSDSIAEHGYGLPADQPDTTFIRKDGIADIERYLQLEDKPLSRVKTVLRYLNEAIVSAQTTARAVSLGTALEVMFGQRGNTSELMFRTSVAAARYLGETAQERKELFDTCKKVYGFRSQAVHMGDFAKDLTTVNGYLDAGQHILFQALAKFVREPIDDWTAVVLG